MRCCTVCSERGISVGKARHVKKLMGGRRTAQEVHQLYAFPPGAKCHTCMRRPLLRAITMARVDDAKQHFQHIAELPLEALVKLLVTLKGVDGKPEPYVRLGMAYACKQCSRDLERTLAKLPSWVCVEINRGPAQEKLIVGGSA